LIERKQAFDWKGKKKDGIRDMGKTIHVQEGTKRWGYQIENNNKG